MDLDKLGKVLEYERQRGFDNRAVTGGLDRFLEKWAAQARRATTHPMVRSGLSRMGLSRPAYDAMPPPDRARWVERVLLWSEGLEDRGPSRSGPPGSAPRAAAQGAQAATHDRAGDGNGTRTTPRRSTTGPGSHAPRRERHQTPRMLGAGQDLATPLSEIKSFRPDLVAKLTKLGLTSLRDLLYFFPRRHIDFTDIRPINQLKVGQDQTVIGQIWESRAIRLGRGGRRRAAEAVLGDESGTTRAVWFNQPYIAASLRQGMTVALSGRVSSFGNRRVFENPEWEPVSGREAVHTARLVPVYPLTQGVTSRRIRSLTRQAIDEALPALRDFLPNTLVERLGMLGLEDAIREAHYPGSEEAKDRSRRRLAFDELFLIQLGVLGRRQAWREGVPAHPLREHRDLLEAFARSLPFSLTAAQVRIIDEVVSDLGKSHPMSRLVQGEVGSGKTVVALAAMLTAAANGQQAVLMAPTELLAEQHHRTLSSLLGGLGRRSQPGLAGLGEPPGARDIISFHFDSMSRPLTLALLMGSTPRKRKQEIQELAAHGDVDIVTGTHALIQKEVEFVNLALAIVDEQHRFGVMQRSELRQKGHNPHLLVMTATPIPRSLSLTLYGDLDISIIDELPPGRQSIRTKWLAASDRDRAHRFIRKQVEEDRQAFIVFPLVEESEKVDAGAATEEFDRLKIEVFPDLRLGLLHGRMKSTEKDRVMRSFKDGDLDILVSTAVVEVGIDVPNASVMMIESAERFGLAQLHQFRGRVGRGEHESYCILVSEAPSPEVTDRLRTMERVDDGFELAEHDLRIRGAGEFFGMRQSGLPDLRMASIADHALLQLAREEAGTVFRSDPGFTLPDHEAMATEVARAWEHRTISVGEA